MNKEDPREWEWRPTCYLRLAIDPTPGVRDELQQLWTRPSKWEGDGEEPEEQWRPVPRVEV